MLSYVLQGISVEEGRWEGLETAGNRTENIWGYWSGEVKLFIYIVDKTGNM